MYNALTLSEKLLLEWCFAWSFKVHIPKMRKTVLALCVCLICSPLANQLDAADVSKLTGVVNKIGAKGQGHAEARKAMAELVEIEAKDVVRILEGFDSNNALAVNWLRAAADTVLENAQQKGTAIPLLQLRSFLADTQNDTNARRVAYEWIVQADASLRADILSKSLNDPSLEIRREAVTEAVGAALKIKEAQKERALDDLKSVLSSARDLDQIDEITTHIESLGGVVNLPKHFGFLMTWNLVGPFDNSGTKGFDVAYAPEVTISLDKSVEGKAGSVKWFQHTTQDQYGMMDLNTIMPEKYKGAIVYAYTTFESSEQRDVELRLGCVNGNKIWVNGELITSNHVYHANTSIDQYIAKARLDKGKNEILLKVAQNEQEESWAQRWQFQLRVCDQYGTAILAADRE